MLPVWHHDVQDRKGFLTGRGEGQGLLGRILPSRGGVMCSIKRDRSH